MLGEALTCAVCLLPPKHSSLEPTVTVGCCGALMHLKCAFIAMTSRRIRQHCPSCQKPFTDVTRDEVVQEWKREKRSVGKRKREVIAAIAGISEKRANCAV